MTATGPSPECPMCTVAAAPRDVAADGYLVAELTASVLLLGRNQAVSGYCMLISTRHVTELHHLPPPAAGAFVNDLLVAAAAVETAFTPAKLNLEIQGNQIPHLHCHIKPRYPHDAAPGRRIPHDRPVRELTEQAYVNAVDALRQALRNAQQQSERIAFG